MKTLLAFSVLTTCLVFLSFKIPSIKSIKKHQNNIECDSIPLLNKQIIDFVKTKIKKKVGRGECWDLAYEALELTKATWDGKYKYGNEMTVEHDCIFPGDIIQFENIVLKYTMDGREYKEKMSHHTAIIYEVKGKGDFILAHQNTSFTGRKVGLSPLDLKNVIKGKFKIYQPVK